MNSFKVFSFLLVVGLSQSAPQISQQGVVSQVLGQLQPAIARTLAEILGGRTSSTQGVTGAVKSTTLTSAGFGQGATGAVSTTSVRQDATSAARTANVGSSRVSSTSSQSGLSASQLTSSVVSSLQPSIAAAVAQALSASSTSASSAGVTSTSSASALTEEEEAALNAQQSANAQYEYGYKVADDDSQSYMAHQETRNGLNVEGSYNYVDANGALVTVTYQAGPEGYTENREVQDGAVQMRTTYGPWSGPFADTVPAGVSATAADVSQSALISSRQQSSTVSQSDLIAQILTVVQPQINTAVQSALSSSTKSVSSSAASSGSSSLTAQTNSVVGSRQSSSAVGQSQTALISNIIGALQPQISGAVQAALSSGRQTSVSYRPAAVVAVRPVAVRRVAVRPVPVQRVAPAAVSSGLTGIFGVAGENNVRIETPDFFIGY